MGQATAVKGAYSGYCLRSIQTDFMNPIFRVRKENGSLTNEESNRFESLVEKSLDVLALGSDDNAEPVTQETIRDLRR